MKLDQTVQAQPKDAKPNREKKPIQRAVLDAVTIK
jgi:hypothetical protein